MNIHILASKKIWSDSTRLCKCFTVDSNSNTAINKNFGHNVTKVKSKDLKSQGNFNKYACTHLYI